MLFTVEEFPSTEMILALTTPRISLPAYRIPITFEQLSYIKSTQSPAVDEIQLARFVNTQIKKNIGIDEAK